MDNNIKSIVEFGTSFGISTLFLAQGVIETGGRIVELNVRLGEYVKKGTLIAKVNMESIKKEKRG